MRFFLDNNLPPRVAKAINALLDPEDKAVHLKDLFPPDVADADWIATLSKEGGWVVISGDARITKNAHERRAWQQSRLTAFFLKKGWMNQTLWLQASRLIQWFPDIMAQAAKVAPGAGFVVPYRYNGRFEQPRLG